MNTLKRKLTAILLTFAMLFSLMPALPQAAEAAEGVETVTGDYATMTYITKRSGELTNTINLNVYLQGTNQLVQSNSVSDAALTRNSITVNIDNQQYEIAGEDSVTIQTDAVDTSWDMNVNKNLDNVFISWTTAAQRTMTINIYLREDTGTAIGPATPEGVYNEGGTIDYRFYDDELLKMVYLYGENVSIETEIDNVKVNFIEPLSPGVDSGTATSVNREEDYLYFSRSDVADKMKPDNVEEIIVTYDGGKTFTIPAKDLKFIWNRFQGGENYYSIGVNNDLVHVVYFVDSPQSQGLTNFQPFDVQFVEEPNQTVANYPVPTYSNGNVFVNWEIDAWDGSGQAFLPTTIVDRDMTVFARKISDAASGEAIHVMNRNGEFVNRLAELSGVSPTEILTDSVKVRIYDQNDKHTNENYAASFGWQHGREYYYVANNQTGTGGVSTAENNHLNFNELKKVEIWFDTNHGKENVVIPIGDKVGEFSKSLLSNINILELRINQEGEVEGQPDDPDIPVVPDKPDADDLEGLIQVKVECTTDSTHSSGNYAVTDDTIEVSDVDSSTNTATVTVKGQPYANLLENGPHSISGSATQTVEVKYVDGSWTLADGTQAPKVLTFQASCQGTTPTGPEEPTQEELTDLLDVQVACTTNADKHQVRNFQQIFEGSYELSELDLDNNTIDVTVKSAKYVNRYNNKLPGHAATNESETVTLKFVDGKWTVDQEKATIVFNVTCPAAITGFEKDLVDAEKADGALTSDVDTAIANSVEIENAGFTIPDSEEDFVVIPNGGSVKLLYSITVTGQSETAFKVTDDGAELVSSAAQVTGDNGVFTGTIPEDKDSVTFYVSKEFNKDNIPNNKLTNTAKIELGDNEDGYIAPESPTEDEESIDGEEGPALPTKDELKKLFDVELDCTSNVGHKNKTYDLRYGDTKLDNFTRDANGVYTVEMTVAGADYLEKFNEASENVVHVVDGDETKIITLTYNNGWTAPEGSSPIEFDVKCSGTGDYDINGIAKDLVAGDDDKIDAQNNGVENLDSFTIPEEGEKVIIPAGESVTLLYSITVTGNDEKEVKFVVTDKDTKLVESKADVTQKDDGTYTGTIQAGGNVTFYVSKEFTGANINKDGELVNTASVDGADDETTVDPDDDVSETVDAEEAISVTPADITIYMGGEQGYEAVVGENGEILGDANNSLPEPGFTVTLPEKLEGTNVTGLTFTEVGGTRTWTFAPYDGKDTTTVYKLVPEEGQEATRVIFTDKEDGHTIVSDEFTVGLEVNTSFDMALYKGSGDTVVGDIETTIGEKTYAVDSDNIGELTVRGTTDAVQFADANDDATSAEAPELDVDDNTTFTINDSNVLVTEDDGIALLFDEVINNNGEDRTGLLEDKADDILKVDADEMSYDFKYLDLVDTHNGNTWVKASDDVTIYWPLPEGTTEDTEFSLLHFEGLHRDMESGDVESAIAEGNVEQLEIEKVENGYVVIKTGDTGFSPFALAWETDNGGSDTPGGNDPWYPPYNPGDDDKPSGLNTEDHFSYVVGYEDGMVKPQRSITRAEVATIFYRLLEDDVRDDYDTTRNNFSDVTSDSWYNQTVSTLASMGILKGYEDGTFRPNASITRAEFAAIATRFFEETGATYEPGTFTDVTGDEWFAGAIMDAVNLGLIGGYEDGTVRPNNNITRAEACAIVNRTLGRVPDADHLLPADEMTTWPDNPSSAWFYADMQEATNGHEYEWITEDGNKIEEWTDILDKDWNDR